MGGKFVIQRVFLLSAVFPVQGLNFVPAPRKISTPRIVAAVENDLKNVSDDKAASIRRRGFPQKRLSHRLICYHLIYTTLLLVLLVSTVAEHVRERNLLWISPLWHMTVT